jgi:hypothetical protein
MRKEEMWKDMDLAALPPPAPLEQALPKIQAQVTGPMSPDRRAALTRMCMGGGTPDDPKWVRDQFAGGKDLSDDDCRAIQSVTYDTNRELQFRVELLVSSIEAARDRIWASNAYRLAPYALASAPAVRVEEGPMISAEAGGYEGWTVGFKVLEADVPGFSDMLGEIRQLVQRRDAAVAAYVKRL